MFCKYCGTQISDDAVFCEKCGKRLIDKEIVQHDERKEESITETKNQTEKGKFLKTVKYSPPSVGIVLSIVLVIIGIVMVVSASNLKIYDSMYKNKDLLMVMGVIIIAAAGISFITDMIVISINSSICCSAYENRIIGRAAKSGFPTNTTDFSLGYDEIDSAKASNKMITIYANGINYIVYADSIEEADAMVNIINSHTKPKDSGTANYYEKKRWKCIQCGSIITEEPCPNCHCEITFWKCYNCGRKNRGTTERCAWCGTPSDLGL